MSSACRTDAEARRIAWIQCVGSRDSTCGNEYCSSICCMMATKQALVTGGPRRGPWTPARAHRLPGRPGQHHGLHRLAQRAEQRERRSLHGPPHAERRLPRAIRRAHRAVARRRDVGRQRRRVLVIRADELAALKAWVEAGGCLITLSGYDAQSQEVTPLNHSCRPSRTSRTAPPTCSGTPGRRAIASASRFASAAGCSRAPLGKHIDEVGAFHGRPIEPGPKAVVDCTDGTTVYAAHEDVGQGHLFTFADEWVTYRASGSASTRAATAPTRRPTPSIKCPSSGTTPSPTPRRRRSATSPSRVRSRGDASSPRDAFGGAAGLERNAWAVFSFSRAA